MLGASLHAKGILSFAPSGYRVTANSFLRLSKAKLD